MGITGLVLHTGTLKYSLECAGESSTVEYKSFRSKFCVFQFHVLLGHKKVPSKYLRTHGSYRSETFCDVNIHYEGQISRA